MKYLLAVLFALTANISLAAIGTVTDTVGNACSITRNKQQLTGQKGAGVEMNDTYITEKCQANITFKDDTKVKVTENSRLLIDDFVYDPKSSDAGKLALKVGAGTVRYASGQIAHNDPRRVNIQTPSATIAVRGTDFTMTVDETGESLIVLLPSCKDPKDIKEYELQENTCAVGKIDVITIAGTVTLDKAFEGTYILGSGILPTPPKVLSITEGKISNGLIIVKPQEIQKAIKEATKTKQDKANEQLDDEAMMISGVVNKQAQQPTQATIVKMQESIVFAVCNSNNSVCVKWQNPLATSITSLGNGTAFRSSQDNSSYAEVKTSGVDSNTLVTITHNDNTASTFIGQQGAAVLNVVNITQNTGLVKVKGN